MATHTVVPVAATSDSADHWRSGEVEFAGEWTTPDRVAEILANDPKQVAYREQRRQCADTAESHFKMAQWCRAQGLNEEARSHWAIAAQLNPQDDRAQRALGLMQHQGQWMTQAEIAESREREDQAVKAIAMWRTKLQTLRGELVSADTDTRNAALEQLRSIRDPFALPTMEELFSKDNESLGLLVVEAAGQILHKAATRSLVRHAVWHTSPRVREAAIEQLRHRDPYFFVGDLIQLIRPVSFQQSWTMLPNGNAANVTFMEDFDRNYLTVATVDPNKRYGPLKHKAGERPENRKYPVQRAAEEIDSSNQFRIENASAALKQTTGETFGTDQTAWLNWWRDVSNSSPSESSPSYRTTVVRYDKIGRFDPSTASCFVAGTPVWTRRGPVPIDHVQLGDLVLARNIRTGELSYQPVVDRTIRRQKATVSLQFDGESIGATPGHLVWAAAKGWLRASAFQAGDLAGSTAEPVSVAAVSQGESDFVYNLVVAKFSTYFVGKNRILVHDFSPVADGLTVQ